MSFDRIAPFYFTLERIAFGNSLQRARIALLDRISESPRALIVGEGNGRFLAKFLRANRSVEIDCVDQSAEMLRLTQERVGTSVIPSAVEGSRGSLLKANATGFLDSALAGGVHFYRDDILSWQPDQAGYDLIVSHFFLDCFDRNQLPRVVEKITSLAAPNARWLISDFDLPPRGFRRLHARVWLRAMYSFFNLTANLTTREIVPFASLLRERGFHLIARRDSRFGLITAQLWQRAN